MSDSDSPDLPVRGRKLVIRRNPGGKRSKRWEWSAETTYNPQRGFTDKDAKRGFAWSKTGAIEQAIAASDVYLHTERIEIVWLEEGTVVYPTRPNTPPLPSTLLPSDKP